MTTDKANTSEPKWGLTADETVEFANLLETVQSMILPGHEEREMELYVKAANDGESWAINSLREIARLAARVQEQAAEIERLLRALSNAQLAICSEYCYDNKEHHDECREVRRVVAAARAAMEGEKK